MGLNRVDTLPSDLLCRGPGPLAGLLVVDKPRGPTSHDIVSRMRRTLRAKAIGHTGTLDPMATGVLVLAIGEATKLVAWLTAHEKSYEATIALGSTTDTLDAEGSEVDHRPVAADLREALLRSDAAHLDPMVQAAFERERGRTMQIPPQFSAIKTGGRRAFVRARRGEETSLAARPVTVQRLDLIRYDDVRPSLSVSIATSKGYYVRGLARDLAEGLGTCGHLTALRRTRSGPFTLDEAVPTDIDREGAIAHIQPLASVAARVLGVARLSVEGARDALHGRAVRASDIVAQAPGPCAWLDERGTLVAIGEVEADGQGRVLRGFAAR
jgi:tRNA pseudouridine55 synthase